MSGLSQALQELEDDIEALTEAEVRLYSVDVPPSVLKSLEDARRKVTATLVRLTATEARPWTVTNECGELRCLVIGAADYHEADHCPDGGTPECGGAVYQGFRIRWPDGREEIVVALTNDATDHWGVGRGPWGGEFYTIARAPESAP